MVVIEQEESEHPNANPFNASNDPTDGFQTAVDADLGSDGEGSGSYCREEQNHAEKQQQTEQEPEHVVPRSTESSENNAKINEEESRLKALDQANDAKVEGNKLFGDGKYEEPLSQYELALQVAPNMPSSVKIRSICHSNSGVCFLKLGKYDNTNKECTKALELNPVYVKALVRRGEAHESLSILKRPLLILEIVPSNDQARKTIRRLEPLSAEKTRKDEGGNAKLKEMGNSVLGRFGMSVDNFKSVKDPNTGSFSVSFQR
ncbi:Tetratricopeptide repeat protein 1 [Glycine max]|nr:Tetratricopeptide repeat protein 1 [Glycine max]